MYWRIGNPSRRLSSDFSRRKLRDFIDELDQVAREASNSGIANSKSSLKIFIEEKVLYLALLLFSFILHICFISVLFYNTFLMVHLIQNSIFNCFKFSVVSVVLVSSHARAKPKMKLTCSVTTYKLGNFIKQSVIVI